MVDQRLSEYEFDAEFFATHQPDHDNLTRLEDLSSEDANNPTGRGSETAAPRGYDNERLACLVYKGFRVTAPWYDVQFDFHGAGSHKLLECKMCIAEYPNGQTGRFKLWKKHHKKLLGARIEYPDTCGSYFFTVYTLVDGNVREIGKFAVSSIVIEGLIDNWRLEHHDTMGAEYSTELTWTRLISALNIEIEDLRQKQIPSANVHDDSSQRFWKGRDTRPLTKNPFQSDNNPYPVCRPSCDFHPRHEETQETA